MEIFAYFGIELSINKQRCEMLTAVVFVGYIVRHGMVAHFSQRTQSFLSFAKCYLIGGNYPIIEGQLIMVVHEIVTVDQ